MMSESTIGYAHVAKDGKIDVRTVSPHARGAKVNALYTVYHVAVLHNATEADIETAYEEFRKTDGGTVQEVVISINKLGAMS